MAETVASNLLSFIFDKLTSTAWEKLAPYFDTDYDIKKLERSSRQIRSLLADASQKETTDTSVKRWLDDLRHLAYDVEDILDDLATEAMRREFNEESESSTSKVRKLFPSNPFSKHSSSSRNRIMKDKINGITIKLQELIEEKDVLGLVVKEETRSTNVNRRLQTSMVQESSIFGRRAEKEALVHKLLRDEPCGQNFSVVPIVGMGGVGKTTLARLVYDEPQVKDHFERKAWVCVSDEFDSFGISKIIFQSVTGVNNDFADLSLLQEALRNHLREKRFLLVLDDVWSESCEDWDTLVGPFHVCAPGSKIIITTRKEQLLKKLGYGTLNQLPTLLDDDALSLLALHSLGEYNFDSHPSLKPYGVGIIKKCDGLPLALKALGRLLSTKKDEEEYWKEVLDSEIWRLPVQGEIVPALILSYHDLSARLKQLFAYCSLFPKDSLLDKEEVVQLWMAEGFLQHSTSTDSTEECLGHEYFDELLSRSFFQHAPNNESLFVMHDLMNDLATSVASGFSLRLEKDIGKEPLEKYRHVSFVRENYVPYKKFEPFKRAKCLRTFLATSDGVNWKCYLSNKILDDLLIELPLLRVLSLSNFNISELPESIDTMKHLRYLNLSRTNIKHLPENVCNLYNLQTLILFGCHSLANLPNSFSKLKNLRHFDVRDTPRMEKMPLGIGELESLQTLSKVIIGVEGGFVINELKDLKNLCGGISIVGLDKVQNAIHAREANISQNRLSELEVEWSDKSHGLRNEMLEKEVLNELKPNYYLKQLNIVSYGGVEFPSWVGDPLFRRLKHVTIQGCKKCTSLPPLGQLQSLKELFIEDLNELEVVGLELLGTSGAFSLLEVLSFKNMRGWKKWSTNVGAVFPCLQQLYINGCRNLVEITFDTNSGVVFPCLQQLHIVDCPSLVEVTTIETLPSLNVLKINKCNSGVLRGLVEVAAAVTKLEISNVSGLNDVVWKGVIAHLGVVLELSIQGCHEIRYLWESEAVASKLLVKLRNLKVYDCDNLVSLGEKEEGDNFLTSLRRLDVSRCKKMESCSCPDNIEMLRVRWCGSLTSISLPTGGQKLKSLHIWHCFELLEKEWGGQKISMPMLEDVIICYWRNLKSIIKLNNLIHLTSLRIFNCENLESFPDNELSSLTSLTHLVIHNCPGMDARGVWPPNLRSLCIGRLKKPITEWGPQNFPTSLVTLWLYGDDGVSRCDQFSHLLPSSLTSLTISGFKKLESFSMELQHLKHLYFWECPNLNKLTHHPNPQQLTSLQHLYFTDCPNMRDIPEALFPSLLSFDISYKCPNLKERYSKGGGDWLLISHIPYIRIDGGEL